MSKLWNTFTSCTSLQAECSMINIIMGYIFSDVPLVLFAYIDAIIKFIFGVYLLFFSKATKQ
ncbi:DUF6609 family protein [Streptococcus cristatus]|uniref:DUF6609 family protein n=1 Tax=Streptococcus cristatus TaxID=45634 RepID=UPI0039C4929E